MKTNSKITFALTGVTGLLGRNLLLEILKQHRKKISEIEILLLGRSTKTDSLHERVMKILDEEVVDYIDDTNLNKHDFLKEVSERIECFDIQLGEPNLSLSHDDYKILANKNIDFFFHIAALTDFRSGKIVADKLTKINVAGTQSILELLPKLKIAEFSYVSSAYVCGMTTGNISPDYVNPNQNFRNYYEKTKLEAEILVRDFCKQHQIKFRIFRPSTISGRLIEKPIGSVSKVDVFYEWCAFFYRYKKKILKKEVCIEDRFEVDLRFFYSKSSGLNIVPADYIAKIIYNVCLKNIAGDSYHAVNSLETPHQLYTKVMLDSINIYGVKHCDHIPENQNYLESLYYRTVGLIYTPYITMEPMLFNTDNLNDIMKINNLSCPLINEDNFMSLMKFVVKKQFNF